MNNTQQYKVGEDMICPITKQHCDDECCTVGAECNLSGEGIYPMNNTQQAGETAEEIAGLIENIVIEFKQYGEDAAVGKYAELALLKLSNLQSPTPAQDAVEAKAKAKKLYPDFEDEYGYPTHIKNMNGDVKKLRKAYLAGHAEGQKDIERLKSIIKDYVAPCIKNGVKCSACEESWELIKKNNL